MNAVYLEIKQELELMQQELRARLKKDAQYLVEVSEELFEGLVSNETRRRQTVLQHMHEDLKDVERALLKMEIGMYGICEETGQSLPLEQLRIMPTARTVHEFLYNRLKTI